MPNRRQRTITAGNIPALSIPVRSPANSLTIPARAGPQEQPMSPHTASRPNMAAPPFGKAAEVELSTPGHIRLIEKPQRAQHSSDSMGCCKSAAPI